MALNPFFDNFTNGPEQDVLQKLIIESIQMYGYDFNYLPRRGGNVSDILNSDDMSFFDKSYTIEMYIRNVEGFSGDGNFLSKFGLEIRDRITFSMARTRFDDTIRAEETFERPREGDLIYFPMTKRIFEIKYVENKAEFYPLGSLPIYDIQCEMFEYNNERFTTGIADIDRIQTELSTDLVPWTDTISGTVDPFFDPEEQDEEYDNLDFDEEFKPLVDYTVVDPFSKGKY